jgi:hypothetical protein
MSFPQFALEMHQKGPPKMRLGGGRRGGWGSSSRQVQE